MHAGDAPLFRRGPRGTGTFDTSWAAPAQGEVIKSMVGHSSMHDGGQLAFLLQTRDGSALFTGRSGYWPGIFAGLRPDVAFLALGGRPNVSGEPYQGPDRDDRTLDAVARQPHREMSRYAGLPGD